MIGILVYGFIVLAFYASSLIVSLATESAKRRVRHWQQGDEGDRSDVVDGVSIIVPAYNEEEGIVGAVQALMKQVNYARYEVIVVNDGSTDGTMLQLRESFQLVQRERADSVLSKTAIRGVYQSALYPKLTVVDKQNGGKADALNAGIDCSTHPYFLSLDADTELDSHALTHIMKPIMEAPKNDPIVASGGTVYVNRGSSQQPLVAMQFIEYVRAFFISRMSLSRFNMLLLLSGSFAVFRKEWVVRAGGYLIGSVGEDMELTIRLHRLLRDLGAPGSIRYDELSNVVTEAPERWRVLRRQRTRWHRGAFESLWHHRTLFLNPKYGRIGLIAVPYYVLIELLGPVIELTGYILVLVHVLLGGSLLQPWTLILFGFIWFCGSLLSITALLWDRRHRIAKDEPGEFLYLLFYACTESLWYRPIQTTYRVWGLVQLLTNKRSEWGMMRNDNHSGT